MVFGFWDEEEQGLVGSAFWAGSQAANDVVIKGVVNMDAIAYDGNADRKARVHVRPIANSLDISDTVVAVLDRYNFDIDLIVTNPGATYSDHASFWNEGYGAVLMIEEFTNDGNPTYHTQNDRVEFFDVPYYEELAKLSIASFAILAIPYGLPTAVSEIAVSKPTLFAFPNPASVDAQLWLDVPVSDRYSIRLVDALGKEVALLHDGVLAQGKHVIQLPMASVAPGTYSVQADEQRKRSTCV
ncbi:MAG: M28 family peptidase [Flavobacteriales bacterium]|nr:M28 family peptidase [Flavobacteriales bacterium]